MSNEVTIDGASYCSKVTINGTVLADKIMACHFTDCQKFSGAPFRAVAVMSAVQVAISGAVKEYLKMPIAVMSGFRSFVIIVAVKFNPLIRPRYYLWSSRAVCPKVTSLCLRSIFLANLHHHG